MMDFGNLFIKKTKIKGNPYRIQEVIEENYDNEKDPQDIMNYAYLGEKRLNLQLIEKVTALEKIYKKKDKKENLNESKPKNEITMKELTEILNKNMSAGNDLDTAPMNTDGNEKKYSIDKKIFKLYELFNKFHKKEIANILTKAEILKRKSNELIESDSKAKEGDKLQKVMENVFNLDNLNKKVNEKHLKANDILKKKLEEKIIKKPVNSKIRKYIRDKFLFYQDDINHNHINYLIDELFEGNENLNSPDNKKSYKFELSRTESDDDDDFDKIPDDYQMLNNYNYEDHHNNTIRDLETLTSHSRRSLKNLKSLEYNFSKGKLNELTKGNSINDCGKVRHRKSEMILNELSLPHFNNNIIKSNSLNQNFENNYNINKINRDDGNKKSQFINNFQIDNLNEIKTKKSINPNKNSLNSLNRQKQEEQTYLKKKSSESFENNNGTFSPENNNTKKKQNDLPQIKSNIEENKFKYFKDKNYNENEGVSSPISNFLISDNKNQDLKKRFINNLSNINTKRRKLSPINVSSVQDKDSTRFNSKQNSNLINSSVNNSSSICRNKYLSKSIDVSNSSPFLNRVKRSFDYKTHGIDDIKLFSYLKEVTKNTKGKFLNYKDSIIYNTIEEFFDNNTIKNDKTEQQLNLNETQKTKIFLNSLLSLGNTLKSNKDCHNNNNHNAYNESKLIKYNIELDHDIPIRNIQNIYSFYNNNVKTHDSTIYNSVNPDLNKDKINFTKNSQGTKIPFVYTKYSLNDYSSDEDENKMKNKSHYMNSNIEEDTFREENEENTETKREKKRKMTNNSKHTLNLYTFEETVNTNNKNKSPNIRSQNQKEFLLKKEEKVENIDKNNFSFNIRKLSNETHRKIINENNTSMPNKIPILKNNTLVLPSISQSIDIKRKEPISKYNQIANEKLRNSLNRTKSKIRTAFMNNEEEETLKKGRF